MGDMADMINDGLFDDRDEDDFESFDCTMLCETNKAWLMELEEEKTEEWFPKSQCEFSPNRKVGVLGKVTGVIDVPAWLAKRKGLL